MKNGCFLVQSKIKLFCLKKMSKQIGLLKEREIHTIQVGNEAIKLG